MKNLRAPRKHKVFYDRIVAAKNPSPDKNRLQALAAAINLSYRVYCNRARNNQLTNYAISGYAVTDHAILKDCYGSESEVINLKNYIRNRQESHLRYVCQYCMIGISNTFDHYLPQTPFPEFSVLAHNLVPACGYCNTKKWQNWKDANNERRIINFYYDQIPNAQFLRCDLVFRRNVPVATFTLQNLGGINQNTYNLITRHFSTLETISWIHSLIPTEVEKIGIEMNGLLATHNLIQARNFLIDQANGEKNKFGSNYCWALLKETLANSNRYLQWLGFN